LHKKFHVKTLIKKLSVALGYKSLNDLLHRFEKLWQAPVVSCAVLGVKTVSVHDELDQFLFECRPENASTIVLSSTLVSLHVRSEMKLRIKVDIVPQFGVVNNLRNLKLSQA